MSHGTISAGALPYRASATGLSANNSVDALTLDTGFLKNAGFVIQNMDASNSFDVQIVSKMLVDGVIEYEELGWTTVAADSMLRYFEKEVVGLLILRVKSTTTDQHATYLVEYMGVR